MWGGLLWLGAAAAAEFPSELTLPLAVERALAGRATLQAANAAVTGAGGLVRQAGLRPNPSLNFQSENWRFTGTPGFQPGRELDIFAYVAQPIEAAGKRERRLEAARQETRVAELERQGVEWRIRQEVKRAFWTAWGAERQFALVAENTRYFQQVIEYHRARVEQGAMAEADLIRVRLEGERLELAERAAEAEVERARLELLRALGERDTPPRFRVSANNIGRPAEKPVELAALLRRARTRRVEILHSQALVERARAQVGVQQAVARPDWTVAFGYKRTAGYNTVLAGVSVPLPALHRNQGNIAHAMAEVDRSEALLRAALAQVDAEVATALGALTRRQAMLNQLETGVLDRADQSWRIALAAYRESGIDLLRLLDAQRARHEVQLLQARTQTEYQLDRTDLESAMGEELP
jgi:cobalt-zinc-cadmium efflux system outer membrane protein